MLKRGVASMWFAFIFILLVTIILLLALNITYALAFTVPLSKPDFICSNGKITFLNSETIGTAEAACVQTCSEKRENIHAAKVICEAPVTAFGTQLQEPAPTCQCMETLLERAIRPYFK